MADVVTPPDPLGPWAGILGTLGPNTSLRNAISLRQQLREASPSKGQIPIKRALAVRPELAAMPGLAPTDYAGQLGEASQMAKLQLGLALAQRGFGSMGAQPRPGEMAISTVGRELLSPLAGDAMTVAQQMYDQKLKLKAAEKAQQAALSQAALSIATSEQEARLGFLDKAITAEMGRARIAPKTAAVKDVQLRTSDEDGKITWNDVPAISVYNAATGDLEYRGPGNVLLEFDPEKDDYNARILGSGETGSPYQPSKTEQIVINKPFQEFMRTYYDINIPDDLLGTETTMETYLPKGGFEEKPRYNVLNFAGTQYDTRWGKDGEAIPAQALANAIELWRTPATPTEPSYKDHLVVVDQKSGLALKDDRGRRVEVSRGPGNQLFKFGTEIAYTQPDNTLLKSLADYDAAKAATADAATARAEKKALNLDAFFGQLSTFQDEKIGIKKPYARTSALYFDLGQYMKDGFGFKHVVDFDNRGLDEEITDPKIREWLTGRTQGILEQRVAGIEDLSDTQGQHRLRAAMADVLKFTQADYASMTGAVAPRPGEPVQETSDIINRRAGEEAIQILKHSDKPPAQVFNAVTRPRTRPNMNSTWGKLWVAEESFPETFSQYDVANVDANQRRADIEAALPRVQFDLNKETEDHRQKILDAANKIETERNKLQTKPSSLDAEEQVANQLIFRQALLDFENAALAAGNVTGFITGPLVKGAVAIGMADFVQGAGKDAYERLVAAGDELERGWSRKIGRTEFLDTRISNYDAMEYKHLVAKITSSPEYNRVLIQQALKKVDRNLTNWMDVAGRVAYSERILNEVAKTGVDFSALRTRNNWDGYGYFGRNKFVTSGQSMPGLSDERRETMKAEGRLADTQYKGTYMMPSAGSITWTNSVGSFNPDDYEVGFMTPEEVEAYAQILMDNGTITNAADLYDLIVNFKTVRQTQYYKK